MESDNLSQIVLFVLFLFSYFLQSILYSHLFVSSNDRCIQFNLILILFNVCVEDSVTKLISVLIPNHMNELAHNPVLGSDVYHSNRYNANAQACKYGAYNHTKQLQSKEYFKVWCLCLVYKRNFNLVREASVCQVLNAVHFVLNGPLFLRYW
uniref:Uncharacterized protein n=1 Tax=Cacopsylla melanoneura TaxID=428564 RepID=A0A8D8XAZ4_9HEMI